MKVTEGESRVLLDAGAIWIGPEDYAFKPLHSRPTRLLEKFHLQEFKAHRSTELQFSRFTMLVGDNASGKTSVLDALAVQGSLRPPIEEALRGARSIPTCSAGAHRRIESRWSRQASAVPMPGIPRST